MCGAHYSVCAKVGNLPNMTYEEAPACERHELGGASRVAKAIVRNGFDDDRVDVTWIFAARDLQFQRGCSELALPEAGIPMGGVRDPWP